MCRYAFHSYKPHYVCFNCRKTFKQPILEEIVIQNGDWDAFKRTYLNYNSEKARNFRKDNPSVVARLEKLYKNKKYICPDCGGEMNNIGLDFKAPKKHKVKEWEIVKSMYQLGNTFHSCGCEGPGYIPKNKIDYLLYLDTIKIGYEEKLNQRSKDFSASELQDYLEYWKSKLDSINFEINKVKAG